MIKFGKNLAEKLELLSAFPVLLNPKLGRRSAEVINCSLFWLTKFQLKTSFPFLCMRQQKNACFINRYCFARNEPNPRDWCQQCIPEVNTSSWTKRQGKCIYFP